MPAPDPSPNLLLDLPANALIEAVPNFSEGRRADVLDALAAALQSAGALLLDRTADWDHHRSVFTVAGSPAAVTAGLLAAVRVAAAQINLFQPRGVHPRLGATDVVPLVPLRGVTLDQCVALARALGQRIAADLDLPVYLYEAAALRADRRNLADVRRGEFEELLTTIATPARAPDYGPPRLGPAGAVIVGARPVLIAYNIFLASEDVQAARTIARAIRASSGGLPGVKALGLLVDGQAQVSINLVDYTLTPLHIVFDRVAALAAQRGIAIARSELIGLLPQEVMLQAAAHYLQLSGFAARDTIEGALARHGVLLK